MHIDDGYRTGRTRTVTLFTIKDYYVRQFMALYEINDCFDIIEKCQIKIPKKWLLFTQIMISRFE